MIKFGGTWLACGRRAIFAVLIFSAPVCPFGQQEDSSLPRGPADTVRDRVLSVYDSNRDCVVKVTAQKPSAPGRPDLDACSGFLASKDGHVITSALVTYNAIRLWVEWKGVLLEAEPVGFDPLTTLSVIRVKNGFASRKAPFVDFDSRASMPAVASPIILISRELGLPPTPRAGLVAGHDINFGDLLLPAVYLRTNIPSFKGSVGSPAFDFDGSFAGMLVASLPDTNGSFLMPAKAVAKIRDDIILCGEPVYGWFGMRGIDGDDGKKSRVSVNFVIGNSPADKAGFLPGDVILEANGAEIENNIQLRNITFYVRPGETVRFKVMRGREVKNIELLVEKLDSEAVRSATEKLGPALPASPAKGGADSADKVESSKDAE